MNFEIPSLDDSSSRAAVAQALTPAFIPRNRLRSNSGQELYSSILNFDTNTKRQPQPQANSAAAPPSPAALSKIDALRRRRQRANTTNSLFSLHSTMETTPTHITLACIAHVVFRHLVNTASWLRERPASRRLPEKWMVFDDSARTVTKKREGGVSVFLGNGNGRGSSFSSKERGQSFDFDFEEVPEEAEILTFLKTVYETAQLEMDTLVTSLAYIERLLGVGGRRGMLITARNWRTIVFTSLVLASKMMDDWTMWSSDFARILGCSPQRLSELEMKFLEALRYDVNLKSSDYARYHFTLRSLAHHLSLEGDEIGQARLTKPLQSEAAKTMSGLSKRLEELERMKVSAAAAAGNGGGNGSGNGGEYGRGSGGGSRDHRVQSATLANETSGSGSSRGSSSTVRTHPVVRRMRGGESGSGERSGNGALLRERSESAFVANDVIDQTAPELNLLYTDVLRLKKGRGRKASKLKRKDVGETTFLSMEELMLSGGTN